MSASGLKLFLGDLVETINELPSSGILRQTLNLEPHTFKFTPTQLYNTLLKAQKVYQSDGWKLTKKDKEFMNRRCFKYGKILTEEIKALGGKGLGKGGVVFEFTTSTDVDLKLSPRMEYLREKGIVVPHDDDVFQKVKSSYYTSMNAMFQELQDYFAGRGSYRSEKTGKERTKGFRDKADKGLAKEFGSVVEAGHEHGAGIAETSLKQCWDQAFEANKDELAKSGIKSSRALQTRLKKLGFNLSVIRADDGEGFVIQLEDRAGNAREGVTVKNLKNEFIAACNKTIEKIDLGKIKSSDSIEERNRKLIIKEVAKDFKRLKNVKVTTENTKIKRAQKSKQTETLGKVKTKKSSGIDLKGKLAITVGRRKKERKPQRPRMALANILGVLNGQLPTVVARNMGSPRLENRTGRFAQSVRATDVTQTAQGFPSIGYTYMKERYGPYESTSGTRFADPERDPRPLIDQSIREIVIGFGLGRIYTRRQ
tara:strand:+ start:45 stop:1490 length:1446 start_codon:yes stop_codon:yes gene_type:complete